MRGRKLLILVLLTGLLAFIIIYFLSSGKARLARHYYDLWCLIKKGIAARAVQHQEIFSRTAKHREVYFNWSWMDYATLKQGTLRILPLKEQEASWRQDYQAMAGEMFFGDIPGFNEILKVIGEFEHSFNKD